MTEPHTSYNYVDVVFDAPPGTISGRFVEVEDERGASIEVGKWVDRDDEFWALRIPSAEFRRTTGRCPSCDHVWGVHDREGCRFEAGDVGSAGERDPQCRCVTSRREQPDGPAVPNAPENPQDPHRCKAMVVLEDALARLLDPGSPKRTVHQRWAAHFAARRHAASVLAGKTYAFDTPVGRQLAVEHRDATGPLHSGAEGGDR